MFCSFAKSPRIMRFFCKGSVVEWDDARFERLVGKMGKKRVEGARAVILLDVFKVGFRTISRLRFYSRCVGSNIMRIRGSFFGNRKS